MRITDRQIKKTFRDLEHSRLAGNTATFTSVITSRGGSRSWQGEGHKQAKL